MPRPRAHTVAVDVPETRYARDGSNHIAYQTLGEGPPDVVFLTMWFSNVEAAWDLPALAAMLRRTASVGRLIHFDKRGTGLSDPVPLQTLSWSQPGTLPNAATGPWRDLLERHRDVVRRQLERHRGREVNTRGDDFLATFEGPARAIHCASAIVLGSRALGIDVRAGLHTGEVELMGCDVSGTRSTSARGSLMNLELGNFCNYLLFRSSFGPGGKRRPFGQLSCNSRCYAVPTFTVRRA